MSASASRLGARSIETLRKRTSEKWSAHPDDVVPAFVAEMDFDVAEPICEAVIATVAANDFGYPHASDLPPAFAEFAAGQWGWKPVVEHAHAAADVMTGVAVMLAACTPPGSGVVVNPPVYPPFFFRTEQSERRVVPAALRTGENGFADRAELDLEAIDRALAAPDVAAYLLCSPHNPLGRVWTEVELLDVAEICWRRQVVLLVDEIHAPLVLEGSSFVPFLSLDHPMTERTIVFHSASKGWNIPDLKCGLLVAGSDASSALASERWEALFPSHLGVKASVAAFTAPESLEWLRAVLAQLDENRHLLRSLCDERLPELSFREPEASFLVWLDCSRLGLGDDPAAAFLERGRLALSRGLDFGEPGRGHARLNIGTSPAILGEIVERMAAALS